VLSIDIVGTEPCSIIRKHKIYASTDASKSNILIIQCLEEKIYLTLDLYTVAIHNFKSCYNTLITIHDELMKEQKFLEVHVYFSTNSP
jgi:hypothetical protein